MTETDVATELKDLSSSLEEKGLTAPREMDDSAQVLAHVSEVLGHFVESGTPTLPRLAALIHERVPFVRIDLVSLDAISEVPFLARPLQDPVVLIVAPYADRVAIAIDPRLPADLLRTALLHGVGHVLLGHIRPGDECGHRDTTATIRGEGGVRRWDRQVIDALASLAPTKPPPQTPTASPEMSVRERLRFALIKDGPKLPGGRLVGIETAPITPWPHQAVVARRLVETWPYSYLLCDEVGLGKTIESGLALRSLILSGVVKRVLVAAPASLAGQWQRELSTKFFLPFALALTGAGRRHRYLSPREREVSSSSLYAPDLVIVSTGLLTRVERQPDLREAKLFDIVLLDEAHYARRDSSRGGTIVEPRYGHLYETMRDLLRKKAQCFWLATATPMQLDPIEVADLVQLSNRVGAFQYDPRLLLSYYDVLGKLAAGAEPTAEDWEFLRRAVAAIEFQDPILWQFLQRSVIDGKIRVAVRQWLEQKRNPKRNDRRNMLRLVFSAAPLSRVMLRHTRRLLEIYRQNGKLGANLARRKILSIPRIVFNDQERQSYDQLESYCLGLAQQVAAHASSLSRSAVGFLLSFLRLRFASSLFAARETLRRRRDRVQATLSAHLADADGEDADLEAFVAGDDDFGDEDAVAALLHDRSREDLLWERQRLEELLQTLEDLSGPSSKMIAFLQALERRRIEGQPGRLKQTVVFTRFYDTLTDLVYRLRQLQPDLRIGTYSGQGGQYVDAERSQMVSVDRDEVKHRFLRGEIDLLICTDAAAEGLNLQTANLLINFDLPWNPMKVEQRIGRIDRIGQRYPEVFVLNLCYVDSVEQFVYERLLQRLVATQDIVGTQQIGLLPVTLGSIAREKHGEPGLIPARIHGFFRGLHALYACINPTCSGRQDRPGEVAVLGKLFAEPHISCDICGSRVFELASCRNCGSPYLQAYCPQERLGPLDFLWGETEGNLQTLELLPIPPRYAEVAEEIRIHLPTGYVDREHTMPDNQVRSVWLAHGETGREATFPRCAMCQPPGSRSRSRITDFRTKGEQPFTALIDAQFAEQPPQKADKRLANQGRKVLVFSDGRQKAARLAPALEHSHARDLFRQVLGIGAAELKKQAGLTGLDKLYPAVIWVCHARGIDLFPAPDEEVFHDHLRRAKDKTLGQLIEEFNQGYLQPTQSYAQQLFGEMTDRYYSLNALALATVEEDPLVRGVFKSFPPVGLPEPDVLLLFRLWLRLQLENRRFAPQGADLSKLGEGWERPEGMDARNSAHVIPRPFGEFLLRVLGTEEMARQVEVWLPRFIRESNLFLLSNDLYYLQPRGLSLNVKLDAGWLRCRDCARLYAETLGDCCPACLGDVVVADRDYLDARTGFYCHQMLRAFEGTGLEPFGLTAAEHSAQLTGKDDEEAFSKTERYELRFQDIPVEDEGPIDVLSCTTTMEVGIDIGTLCGVALRNVPPHVANYQQRAGRAGRRGRSVASVITFAHGTSHDSHYYEHPDHIISGEVNAPVVYIENQQVLCRHINAYLVQRFFHETAQAGADTFSLFESLGTVEQFLSAVSPCSLTSLKEWLQRSESKLTDEIRHWAPRFSYGLNEDVEVEGTITSSVHSLIDVLTTTLPVEAFGQREQLTGLAREGLERQLAEQLLQTFIDRAILPRYAFPTDVVNFWVSRPKVMGDPAYKRSFDYEPQRDLQVALTEYAPGSSLTIDKYRFTSAALYSPYAPETRDLLQKAQSYTACKTCGYVSLQEEAGTLVACPCCRGQDLFKQRFVIPEGFAPDINVRREVDRGDASAPAGRATRAQIEVQDPPSQWDERLYGGRLSVIARAQNLVTVNKGVGDRGFMVCPECGRTEPVFGPGFTNPTLLRGGRPSRHNHPMEQGRTCDGQAVGPYYFGHRFPTDVLLLLLKAEGPVRCATAEEPGRSGRPGRVALTSLAEAVCLAASRILQIEEGELAGNWCPVVGGGDREVYLFLYDLLPGGAGYTRLVKQNLKEVLAETEKLLADCDCLSSCYRCLRHFGNTYLHPSLDRHLAGALLNHLIHGSHPILSQAEKHAALKPLLDFFALKQLKVQPGVTRSGQEVPMVLTRADGSEIWVDVHHALTDPDEAGAGLRDLAEAELAEYCSLDSFTLLHDLPAAVAALQL